MAVNKVTYNGVTLIDLTGDTVAADKLLSGYQAHDRNGNIINGTLTGGSTAVGSLIACGISSNITSVVASFGGATAGAYISDNVAYVVIPRTYTGTVRLDGYIGSALAASTEINISTIDKYTAQLHATSLIYHGGIWEIDNHGFYSDGSSDPSHTFSRMTFSDYASYLTISGNAGKGVVDYYTAGAITPKIHRLGYSKLRFTVRDINPSTLLKAGYSVSQNQPHWSFSGDFFDNSETIQSTGTLDVDITTSEEKIWIVFEISGTGSPTTRGANISRIEFV